MSFNLLGLESSSNRRRSLSATCSSSDESSWSPPDTPTPILNLPLKHGSKLQPGPLPLLLSTKPVKKLESPFSFSLPLAKKTRVSSSSFKTYRINGESGDETETDFRNTNQNHYDDDEDEDQTETELGTILSDVESDLNPNALSENGILLQGGMMEIEKEGDEIDMFLLEDKNIPSSPINSVYGYSYNDRKGKKRSREYENSMDYDDQADGDDEMETEGLLSVKQKGKRAIKYSKNTSTYPNEKSSALSNNFSVVGNICNKLGDLHASSTIFSMNIDVPLHPSSISSYPPEKQSDLSAYHKATQVIGAGVNSSLPSQKLKNRKLTKKRGQPKKHFQQLTASEDPLINLPAIKEWKDSKIKFKFSPSSSGRGSTMDISDVEDQFLVDQEMKSLSDLEVEVGFTAGGNSSDIDMKSVSSFSSSTTKISNILVTPQKKSKKKHNHPVQLMKAQVSTVDHQHAIALKKRSKIHHYAERVPGQHSTSHLRRSSPSSLLPSRRYMTRSHRPPIVTHKYRSKPGRIEVGSCVLGQTFITILRARLSSRQNRRTKMLDYNAKTQDDEWRRMVGMWWGHSQVSKSTNKWWLQIKGPDEVEVEALLPPVILPEDEIMSSPSSSPELNQARKRAVEEASEDLTIGEEVEERWARRNQLRRQELEPYCLNQRLQLQARRAEERRARAEVMRQRLAEIAELRRLEDIQRRETIRLAEEERNRIEQLRLRQEQEEQDRLTREAELVLHQAVSIHEAEIPVPSSPTQSETSTVISEPPEYEFPNYPIILSRSSDINASINPMPRIRRRIISSDILPEYLPDRYNNRSPPPPPPYNARTDCQTLIAPIFIEDSDDEDEDSEDDEIDDEVGDASPLVPSRTIRRREHSPEQRVIGSFPSRQLFVPTPIRAAESIDPIRSFENALDLEEGVDEANDVEGHLDADDDTQDMEEDVVPGGRVAGVFQRVFGMVWGSSSRR